MTKQQPHCVIERTAGITLLDMLIAISLLLILATIGVPSFSHLLNHQKQHTAIRSLHQLLFFARQTAVDSASSVIICPSSNQAHCSNDWSKPLIVFTDKDGNRERNGKERLLTTADIIDETETLSWRGYGSPKHIRFTALGNSQNGSLYYCQKQLGQQQPNRNQPSANQQPNDTFRAQIKINNAGRARTVPTSALVPSC